MVHSTEQFAVIVLQTAVERVLSLQAYRKGLQLRMTCLTQERVKGN